MIESQSAPPAQLASLLDKVMAAAAPNAVFGAPVQSGAFTVITASEITAGGGFGYGGGSDPATAEQGGETGQAAGHGGGGGGGSAARPVAVISIGPDGVKVEPVLDVSKLAIAAITAWGALALAGLRMARRSR